MQTITVRLVQERSKTRVMNVADGKFVQCPRDWRDELPAGRAFTINANVRCDGECWVATRQPITVN